MKRYVVTGLWLYAFWTFGNMVSVFASAPALLGPVLGLAAAVFVWRDPRHMIWTRSAQRAPAASGTVAAAA